MGQFVGLITLAQIAPPSAPTAALAGDGAGNVDDGAHSYKITFVASATETQGGTKSAPVTVADKSANGKVALSGIPISSDPAVTARNVYRTEAGQDPDVDANYKLVATIANNTATTFVDNVADGSLTTVAPTTNDTFATDYPQPLGTTLKNAGMPGNTNALSFLQLAEAGSGDLVISSNPAIASESEGYPVGDETNPLILTASASMSSLVQGSQLYLFSATPGKQAFVIAISKI